MLIATGNGPTGPVAILGLDEVNIAHLKAGHPIHKEMAQFGMPNITLVIVYGETLEAIQAELAREFKLPPVHTYKES